MEILNRKGFTLIELMMALCIMAAVFSIALSGFGIIKAVEEKSSVDELIAELKFAKNDSQIKERENEFEFFQDESRYLIKRGEIGVNEEREERFLSGDLKFFNNAIFRFSKNGTPSISDTVFIKRDNEVIYEVTLSVGTSQIRLYKLNE